MYLGTLGGRTATDSLEPDWRSVISLPNVTLSFSLSF